MRRSKNIVVRAEVNVDKMWAIRPSDELVCASSLEPIAQLLNRDGRLKLLLLPLCQRSVRGGRCQALSSLLISSLK